MPLIRIGRLGQRLLQEKLDDSFIKMLLVNMVLIEKNSKKNEKQTKKTSMNPAGKLPRDPIECRRLLAKLRRIVEGEDLGLEELASLEHSPMERLDETPLREVLSRYRWLPDSSTPSSGQVAETDEDSLL